MMVFALWSLLPCLCPFLTITPHVCALTKQRTFFTRWSLRVADLPPVPDEVYMERVNPLWWGHPGENVVGLVCVDFRADQPQPFTDAVDMGSIGKHEDLEGHASDAIHLMELVFDTV